MAAPVPADVYASYLDYKARQAAARLPDAVLEHISGAQHAAWASYDVRTKAWTTRPLGLRGPPGAGGAFVHVTVINDDKSPAVHAVALVYRDGVITRFDPRGADPSAAGVPAGFAGFYSPFLFDAAARRAATTLWRPAPYVVDDSAPQNVRGDATCALHAAAFIARLGYAEFTAALGSALK